MKNLKLVLVLTLCLNLNLIHAIDSGKAFPSFTKKVSDNTKCLELEKKLLQAYNTLREKSSNRKRVFQQNDDFNITSCIDQIKQKHPQMELVVNGLIYEAPMHDEDVISVFKKQS